MSKKRVLFAWIGHSDFRALAAESAATLQREIMAVVKGELPTAGEWGPIQPFLRSLDYDKATDMAQRWRIAPKVVVNPEICFAQPIVEAAGIPTAVLFRAFRANSEKADAVADWFGVSREDVIAAVEFERGLAA